MAQTVFWGKHEKTVASALRRLEGQRFTARLWNRDGSLWSENPQTQAAIRNRLGWLGIADVMAGYVEGIRQTAGEIRKAGFKQALLLGMGGSGLFSEVCRRSFGLARGFLELTLLDTTDPSAVLSARKRCPLKNLLVIVSSKSGSTAEISALSKYFYDQFGRVDKAPGSHCVVITDSGTPLEDLAKAWRCRRLFTHTAASGGDVGGRFSALTYFGLVPAALMGVDIGSLLERSRAMFGQCRRAANLSDSPAAVLGAALAAFAARGRDKMRLLCSPQLSPFGTWVEQLIAESLGKAGKGIAPIFGEGLRPARAYGGDQIFIELQMAGRLDNRVSQTVKQLIKAGEPVVRIHYEDVYDLGGEIAKWEMATAAAGCLMGLNPFDEPNVKESKERTQALLDVYTRRRRLLDEKPAAAEDGLFFYGSLAQGAKSLEEAIACLLSKAQGRDYIALLSFLARTPALDGQIHNLREALINASHRATMLGFGPRYLHSTGQLYKGGPDASVFLMLTGEDPVDVPIPAEAFSFSVLKSAQALGDFQAMQERGRRVLRIHLSGDLEKGLQRIVDSVKAYEDLLVVSRSH